jgi:4-amino-4-deoxy-L-arabinose transferase-like glycosyltransferase
VAALGLAMLVVAIAGRVGSPWPLEWMEGASMEHARRLLAGLPIYAAPSGEFIPFIYPPLGYVPMALSLWLFGPQLWAARLPSLIEVAVCLYALWRAATRWHGHARAGWLAVGLFGLGYGYTGGFLDLARIDAMFLMLMLLAAERASAGALRTSLGLCVLSCFAKQHGVFFVGAVGLALLVVPNDALGPRFGRRRLLPLMAALAAVAVGLWALIHVRQGWFWTYTMQVPAKHGVIPMLLLSFVFVDLLVYLPVLSGFGAHALWRRVTARELNALDLVLLAGIAASALGRAHPGGDDNVRLPAYACLVLVAAVGLCDAALASARAVWFCAAAALQVLMLAQLPNLYWPSPAAISGMSDLQRALERCADGGSSVAFDHTRLTGQPFLHTQALSDLRMNGDSLGAQATHAVIDFLRDRSAPRAVAYSRPFKALTYTLDKLYEPCADVPAVRLPTGYAIGETHIYRHRAP